RVKDVIVPVYVEPKLDTPAKTPALDGVPKDKLLAYGVPAEWLDDVLQADEDDLLTIADHLPAEAAEALLALATGTEPELPEPAGTDQDPFDHPDAQRRFRVMNNVDEHRQALDAPWERWSIFLHPAQRALVERKYNGP